MRSVSEPIARMANREDRCTGRFWEGRFKCQALLDETAVLSCMAYVDLNPIRAGICKTPEASPHTAIKRRIDQLDRADKTRALGPVAGIASDALLPLSTLDYLALVDWTGRILRDDKRGAIPKAVPPILMRLELQPKAWQPQVVGTESHYFRAIGRIESLLIKAEALGQRWLKGMGAARTLKAAGAQRRLGSAT